MSGTAGAATPVAVGTATTSISVLSINTNGLTGTPNDLNQALQSAFGQGFATTDPVKSPYGKANISLTTLYGNGLTAAGQDAEQGVVGASADSDPDSSTGARDNDPDPFPTRDVSGCNEMGTVCDFKLPDSTGWIASIGFQVGGREACAYDATACPSSVYARIAEASLKNISLLTGMVKIDEVRFDVLDDSMESHSSASQGVLVTRIDVLPLSYVFNLTGIPLDTLIGLADAVQPGASQQVKDAKDSLISTINGDSTITTLLGGPLDPNMSADTLVATAQGLIQDEQDLSPTCPEVNQATCVVGNLLQGPLDDLLAAINDLREAIGAITVFSLENLRMKVFAKATSTGAEATAAVLDLGTIKAFNTTVAVPGDLDKRLSALSTELADVEKKIQAVFPSFRLPVQLWANPETTGKKGEYWFGESQLTPFVLELSVNPSFRVEVLSLSAYAEHRPFRSSTDLANTGPEAGWVIAGLMLLGLASGIARYTHRAPAHIDE